MSVTPKQAAYNVLDRARAVHALSVTTTPASTAEELNRMALATGMAAVDTYMHWRVRNVDLKATPSKALANLNVPFGDLLSSSRVSVHARSRGILDRPSVRVRNTLHEVLLTMTFQTPKGIETAFAMLGVSGYWAVLAAAMPGSPAVPEVKARLGQLANKRNRIVHEGDILRQSRPRSVQLSPHSHVDVGDDLTWIGHFIDALDLV